MIRIELRRPGGGEPLQIDVEDSHVSRVSDGKAVVHVGDYEIRISEMPAEAAVETAKRDAALRSEWADWLFVVGGLAILLLHAVIDDRTSPIPRETVAALINLAGVIGAVVIGGGLISIVSRALNGRFLFFAATRWVVEAVLGFTVLSDDFFGLRWILGGPFLIAEFYDALAMMWVGWVLWRLTGFLFPLLGHRLRVFGCSLTVLLLIFVQLKGLIPIKDKSRFLNRVAAPQMPAPFDGPEVDRATFESQVDRLFSSRP